MSAVVLREVIKKHTVPQTEFQTLEMNSENMLRSVSEEVKIVLHVEKKKKFKDC
jgi:hypothetical protein